MPVAILILNNNVLSNTKPAAISTCNIIVFTIDRPRLYLRIPASVIEQVIILLILFIITAGTILFYNKQLCRIIPFSLFKNIRNCSIWIDLPGWIYVFLSIYCNTDFRCAI